MTICYFTATGNSLYVAKRIGGTLLSIPKLMKENEIIINDDAAKKYVVDDNCILCGTCSKVCPANNISVNDKVIFSDKCEVCYACIHNCLKKAIHVKYEKSSDRFRNEHIALKKIIEANET